MKAQRRNRLITILILLSSIGLAVFFVMKALQSNINLYFTPTELLSGNNSKGQITPNTRIRVGGMVEKKSVIRGEDLQVQFTITDFSKSLVVQYNGILPDLFREGQGIVAMGHLTANNIFQAEEVLAKHDENYMPPGLTVPKSNLGKTP